MIIFAVVGARRDRSRCLEILLETLSLSMPLVRNRFRWEPILREAINRYKRFISILDFSAGNTSGDHILSVRF